MSVIVNLQLSIQPHERDAFVACMERILPDTRSFDGCHWLHITTNIEDQNKFEIFSMWDSKDKYDLYIQWRVETGVAEDLEKFFDDGPQWRFFNVENSY